MYIQGLGTATPQWRYSQQACWTAVQASPQFSQLNPRSRAILKKVLLGNNGIQTRSLALPSLNDVFVISPDVLHKRFINHAPALAALAAEQAMAEAQSSAKEIDALLVSTCTGYLCPGLTSYVTERLGLRQSVFALDLVGQGCAAALPNLRTAKALIDSHQYQRVLCVCAEVCSAAFYIDDDPGVLISACIFGDGAAAAVVGSTPNPLRSIEWLADGSILDPSQRDLLRFDQSNGLLRNVLSHCVPVAASQSAKRVFDSTLSAAGIDANEIVAWIFHSGGRDVISEIQTAFALSSDSLRWTNEVLQNFGNVSSPSVLFALQAALNGGEMNGLWWLSSFGAGFACHGAILKVGS